MHKSDSGQLFVGRQRELAELTAALGQTLGGRGQVISLAGEAGIGKTRTAQEFSDTARERGVRVLWGKCFEEPGAPPYWPWLQILRDYVRSTDEALLRRVIDSSTSSIVELVPELARRIPGLEIPPPMQDVAHARYRLFDAITLHWTRAAEEEPLAIVLDNLHWADTASLRLLEFLAPELSRARVMILATYRDQEVTRTHPMSNTLSEFARLSHYRRIAVTGLAPEETEHYLVTTLSEDIERAAAADFHARTEGLPLYMVESVRYLSQVRADSGHAPGILWRVPEGIRAIIGSRLNRLSADCIEYLRHAAVMGRRFDSRVIDAAIDWRAERSPQALLEEALAARIVEALPERESYQFVHALIRETLYDEIPVPRRAGLHRRIAEVMQRVFATDLDPHLSMLVQHYQSALPDADALHLSNLAMRAAGQADALIAHEEAVRFYKIALQTWEATGQTDPQTQCDLLLKLGRSLESSGDGLEALRSVRHAFDIALAAKLQTALAEAIVSYEYVAGKLSLPGSSTVAMAQEAMPHLRGIDDSLRARVLSACARALAFMGRFEDSNRLADEAVNVARRTHDPKVLVTTLVTTLFGYFLRGEYFDLRRARTEEACALAQSTGDKFLMVEALGWRLAYPLETGESDLFVSVYREFMLAAEATRRPLWICHGTCAGATMALIQGRFKEYETLTRKAFELGRRLQNWDANSGFSVQMFSLYFIQGRLGELAQVFDHFLRDDTGRKPWMPGLMVMHMALDRKDAARAIFDQLMSQVVELPRDGAWPTSIVYLAEVCMYLRDKDRAQTIYDQLAPFSGRNIITAFYIAFHGPIDRLLGMLAGLLERWEIAERHFRGALDLAIRQGAKPGFAYSAYDFARMLHARGGEGDIKEALEQAQLAHQISESLQMSALHKAAEVLLTQLRERGPRPTFPAGLSRREVQILRLIAEGRSNQEIADTIVRSPNTVANHVRNILAKVSAANRTEAATFAARHGLLAD